MCSNGLLPNQLMNTRYKDFAPRFGISWSPDSRTVVRTGFGMFYSQDNSNSPYFDLARNLAARELDDSRHRDTECLLTSNAFPSTSGLTVPVPPPYAYSDNPNHHTAYTMQYLFNVQRQFGASWAVEAGYLGSVSHHLAGFMNQNEGIPSAVGSAASHLPFGDFTFIQSVEDMANAEYNALSLKITKRFSGGLSLTAAYTHAVSIDDSSGIRVQGYDTLFPQNSYCIRCERGLSSFDTRHRLVVSPLYELPVGRGKLLNINNSVANAIIGGWQVGGILTLQSGIPESHHHRRSGQLPHPKRIRPAESQRAPAQASRTRAPRDGTTVPPSSKPLSGQFGNVGRDTATAPGVFTINAEVHKNFRMPYNEHHQLQFRAEAFNVLNHPNFGQPNANILAGAAIPGQPSNCTPSGFWHHQHPG